jgi:glycosyltransferase involved in cell wall biosynthesis
LNKNLALTAALRRLSRRESAPRLVLWHHDLAWTAPRYLSELHAGYPWDLLRTDWPEATQVVVSGLRQRELAALHGVPLERVLVVPNGMDAGAFLKLNAQTRMLVEQAGLASMAPLLLLPVRITRRKNIELAVRVLAELQRDFPAAALVVTGPPGPHNPSNADYFAELKTLRDELGLHSHVHFLAEYSSHYLPDEVIADFYRLADALLLPSREEGFGIPVLEAGLGRLPIFCSDIASLRELGGNWATYFDPDAPAAQVAALIRERLDSSPTYGLSCRVRQQFTWEAIYQHQIAPLLEGV